MHHAALGLVVAYLAGSFPPAYLAGRLLKGVDLRTVGSGNLGATNVYRELGAGAALAVYLIDAAKGALPVWLLPRFLDVGTGAAAEWWAIAYGVAALSGHAKPIFLLWQGGGKGVSTASGVFLALTPLPLAIALSGFILVTVASGFVSLGSLVGAVLLPPIVFWHEGATPVFFLSLAVGLFIWWSHRTNITRLLNGTERSIRRTREKGESS